MSTQINESTACQYLFNQEAKTLFPNREADFVNASLEKLMRVVDYTVKKPGAFPIFDPVALNNQCYLYALMMAQAIKERDIKDLGKDAGERSKVDQRFFYLSFFLSYAFVTDPTLLERVTIKALKEMGESPSNKEFIQFLKEPTAVQNRILATRLALNELFKQHMQTIFLYSQEGLEKELADLAKEDLRSAPTSSSGKEMSPLYTFPNFAGILHLINAIAKERIALVFKVKVVTKEGNSSFIHTSENVQELDPKEPVIIFELIATDDSLSYTEYHPIAKACHQHSRRHLKKKDRHDPSTSCLFCNPIKIDPKSYREKFGPILQKQEEMLRAVGADVVLQDQTSFLQFFSDQEKYPQLTALFAESKEKITPSLLSAHKPGNMTVSHVYTDCAARALEDRRVVDTLYEILLRDRGLV